MYLITIDLLSLYQIIQLVIAQALYQLHSW